MSSLLRSLTRKRKYHLPWKGWKNQSPNHSQRVKMLKNCGKKCFLGTKKSFPICKKNTCKVSKKGVYAAYVRAREYSSKTGQQKYKTVANRAKQMLQTM